MTDMAEHVRRINSDPEYKARWFIDMERTLSIDFDGVIHPYTEGWTGFEPADEPPTRETVEFLRAAHEAGYRIVVSSVRCESEEGLAGTRRWLEKHGLMSWIDDVTCQKPAAIAYIDDRAVPFTGDWDTVRQGVSRLSMSRPHGAAKR